MGHSHDNCPDLTFLRVRLMLLAMAEVANSADEMMNSPEMKPNKPVMNIVPVKISFCKSFMSKSSNKV